MVEKKHTKHIRIAPSNFSFNEVRRGLTAWYDEELLKKYIPPTTGILHGDSLLAKGLAKYIPEDTLDALESTEFVSVFGRVVQSENRRGPLCLQYLYVWDFQAVPLHEGDYEPVFVYLDGNEHYIIYDLVHYCTRRLDITTKSEDVSGLRMIPGWHSFLPSTLKKEDIDVDLPLTPLSDEHLQSWWNIPDEPSRFKIEGYIHDPFRLKTPGHFMDTPDEEAKTMCCTFVEIENAFHEFDDPRTAIVEGFKRAFARCIGIFAIHKLPAFIQLLREMNDVGLITIPPALKEGLNIASIGSLLSDGFVSLTEKGKSFFEGLSKNSE